MGQPLNTDIKIYRALRSYRQTHRNESVAALIKHLRPLVMSIPADETLVEVKSRDTNTKDFSPYMGEARHNATRGFPIVIGLKDQVSFSNAQENLTGVDFAFQIGGDFFLKNSLANITDDLHQGARDLSADL